MAAADSPDDEDYDVDEEVLVNDQVELEEPISDIVDIDFSEGGAK